MKNINIQDIFDDYILEKKTLEQFNKDYIYNSKSLADDVKYVIMNKLEEWEKRLFLIYIETGSLRETGKVFHCSYSKIHYVVRDIKAKIIEELNKL